MALSAMFILEVVIVFSFIVTSLFMFITKSETVHKIFFALAIMLGILVTVVSATSLPTNMVPYIIMSWLGLVPSALAVIIAVSVGRPNVLAKLLVMATTVYGVVGYLLI